MVNGPARADIAHLRIETFDLQPDHRSTGKCQHDPPGRRVGRLEMNEKQGHRCSLLPRRETAESHLANAIKMQSGAAALQEIMRGRDPVKSRQRHHKPVGAGLPCHVARIDDRVLQIGRDNRQILGVKRQQPQGPRDAGALFVYRYGLLNRHGQNLHFLNGWSGDLAPHS